MNENDNVGLGGLFDLSFEKLITPSVVKILYIVILVLSALGYLFILIAGLTSGGILGFLLAAVFGALWVLVMVMVYRIFLELTMILFRIHDNTEKMANQE